MADHTKDPYLSYRFRAEIDGLQVGGFNEVSGLTFENEVETFREGGVNAHERQLPGPAKYASRVVLKRGVADADDLWSWYSDVMQGIIARKTLKITLLDGMGNETRGWIFRNACPVKWIGPTFQAGASQIAFESVELVHEGLQQVY
jgi:phage tail-like protein